MLRLAVFALICVLSFHGGEDLPTEEVTITPVGNEMKYETTEIEAEAGTELPIIFENTATR